MSVPKMGLRLRSLGYKGTGGRPASDDIRVAGVIPAPDREENRLIVQCSPKHPSNRASKCLPAMKNARTQLTPTNHTKANSPYDQ